MNHSARVIASLLCSAALSLTTASAQAQVRYQVTDLGVLGGPNSHALAVNERGQVVGDSTVFVNGDLHSDAVLFEGGTITALPGIGGLISSASGINNRGTIVGISVDTSSQAHAVVWERMVMTELPTLGGLSSQAVSINQRGDIVGTSQDPTGLNHAVRWSGSTLTDLGSLEGGNTSAAAINDRGQIVGGSRMILSGPYSHAYVWYRGTMTDLDTADPLSVAEDINNDGVVVGNAGTDPSQTRAAMFRDGQVIRLGTLGGRSYAHAINDLGVVVGESQEAVTRATHAFIWQEGVLTDLNHLVVETDCVVGTARDITESGLIVGSGRCGDGLAHALLLTPVP